MSEPTFPFEGQLAAEAPPVEAEPKSRRSALLALGGLAAAAVLGVAGYFLVFAGGEEADQSAAPVSRPPAAQPEAPDAADQQPAKQPRISDKTFGRDPFEPLIVEQAVSTVPASGDTTGDPATGPTTGTGSTDPQPTTPTPVASESHVFQVVAVADNNSWITVKVDGKRYKQLQAGEVFATYFKVLVIGGNANAFQFGDDQFTLVGKKPITLAN